MELSLSQRERKSGVGPKGKKQQYIDLGGGLSEYDYPQQRTAVRGGGRRWSIAHP